MAISLQPNVWHVKNSEGNYLSSAILSTTLPQEADALLQRVRDALTIEEIDANTFKEGFSDDLDSLVSDARGTLDQMLAEQEQLISDIRSTAQAKADAQSAAAAAAQSATAASGSATAAAGSASNASDSANAAGQSASAASQSATAASNSATAASGSATAASNSATAAAGSASDARTVLNSVVAETQDILDSIPSDYSDLSDDVADLSRHLSDVDDTKAPVILETASGAIANFSDGADGMPIKKLVAKIEPVQAAGTPSPENPLSISGWTGANINQIGLPPGYKAVDYVTVKDAVRVPTDIDFNAINGRGVSVISTFKARTYRKYAALYSVYYGESYNATRIIYNNAIHGFLINNSSIASRPSSFTADASNWHTVINSYGEYTLDGSKYKYGVTYGDINPSNTFTIGAANAAFDIRGIVVRDFLIIGGEYRLCFIPCINDSGVAGFWEAVNGKFYTTDNPANISASGEPTKIDYLYSTIIPVTFTDPDSGDPVTIYGGTVTLNPDGSADVISIMGNIASYDGETLPGAWISSMDVYEEGVTPTTGAQVVYELAEPVSYHLDDVGQLKTFLGTNNVWCDTGDVTELVYPVDTKAAIDAGDAENASAISTLSGSLATVETTSTASKAYSVGDLLVYNSQLYKVASAIAAGGTLTPGTNIVATTVETELDGKQDAPATAGTAGQVLSLDDSLNPTWREAFSPLWGLREDILKTFFPGASRYIQNLGTRLYQTYNKFRAVGGTTPLGTYLTFTISATAFRSFTGTVNNSSFNTNDLQTIPAYFKNPNINVYLVISTVIATQTHNVRFYYVTENSEGAISANVIESYTGSGYYTLNITNLLRNNKKLGFAYTSLSRTGEGERNTYFDVIVERATT